MNFTVNLMHSSQPLLNLHLPLLPWYIVLCLTWHAMTRPLRAKASAP